MKIESKIDFLIASQSAKQYVIVASGCNKIPAFAYDVCSMKKIIKEIIPKFNITLESIKSAIENNADDEDENAEPMEKPTEQEPVPVLTIEEQIRSILERDAELVWIDIGPDMFEKQFSKYVSTTCTCRGYLHIFVKDKDSTIISYVDGVQEQVC